MNPAQLIAANLAALPHPDGTPRQLPGFANQLLPDSLQQEISQAAQDIGESIINLLETNGYTVTNQPATIEPPATPTVANVHCSLCDTRLLQINLVNPEHTLTNGPLFLKTLAGRAPECPHA